MNKFFLLLMFFSFTAHTSVKEIKLSATCDIDNAANVNFFSVTYIGESLVRVEVNTNQIYVIAKRVDGDRGGSNFFFEDTDSIGIAGVNINWDNISKTMPMFRIDKLNERDYVIEWFGFFDETRNMYSWSKAGGVEVDLYSSKAILQNCENY
ncbi:hypothetical protein TW84_19550 [Vibrio neptunius]|uniref:hypothetical protein n=1 Tax=Vibrio TaxID=662 RepID=UPI0005F9C664|nr:MULTISPECIES: hypothetical protein [Vibrio]KJY86584.1 hypothetical protein TW84_19550 [Vibrio neptunius]NRB68423.1 hypothetical protein [Vibrio sp.]